MQLVLRRVEVNERQIVLEIYGGACTSAAQAPAVNPTKSGSRSETPNWLPGQVSGVLVASMPRALRGFGQFPVPDLIAV
jgi:hypothetical protein